MSTQPHIASETNIRSFFLLIVLGVLGCLLAQNSILVVLSIATLAIIWFGAFVSPFRIIMAASLSFQWLQVTMPVWLAEIYRIDFSVPETFMICATCRPIQAIAVTPAIEQTMIFALAGIVMLGLGARVLEPRVGTFQPAVLGLSPIRLVFGYFAFATIYSFTGPFVGGGLAQPLLVLGSLKFTFAILLLYVWISTRRGGIHLFGVILVEIVIGLTSYFSDFKTIFLVIIIGSLTIANLQWMRVRRLLVGAGIALAFLGAVWTTVKPAYRIALNQGARSQTITISVDERLSVLGNLLGAIDISNIGVGAIQTALRIAYIEIPSHVIERIPAVQPYEYGTLWGEAIYQVITPRLLFPDKPPLPSDSERTRRYTGRWYDEVGSSISMGYFTESYIDFGILGGLLIPFTLGLLYALLARNLLAFGSSHDAAFRVAVLIVVLSPVQLFEISNIKLVPAVLWNWIVASIVISLLWPRIQPFFYLASTARQSPQLDRQDLSES